MVVREEAVEKGQDERVEQVVKRCFGCDKRPAVDDGGFCRRCQSNWDILMETLQESDLVRESKDEES